MGHRSRHVKPGSDVTNGSALQEELAETPFGNRKRRKKQANFSLNLGSGSRLAEAPVEFDLALHSPSFGSPPDRDESSYDCGDESLQAERPVAETVQQKQKRVLGDVLALLAGPSLKSQPACQTDESVPVQLPRISFFHLGQKVDRRHLRR